MSVSQVLASHTAAELTELQAYERLYGSIGDDRLDLVVGVLTSVLANIHRDKKAAPFTPLDFMPYHGEERDAHRHAMRRKRNAAVYSKVK